MQVQLSTKNVELSYCHDAAQPECIEVALSSEHLPQFGSRMADSAVLRSGKVSLSKHVV